MDIKMNFFKREKIEFFLFGCSLFLYLFFSILSSSFYYRYFGGFYFNCLIVLCILLLLIKEIIHWFFSLNDVFFLSISIFVFFIVFRQVGLGVAGFIPFVFSARTIKITRVLKIIMYTCTLTLIFIVASSKLGVIENYVFYDGRLRHYLGFRYSLYPSAIFFNITAMYVFLKKRKISLYGILMLLGLNFYFYFQTKSILSFVSAVCLLFFSFIGKFINFEKLRKFKVMFFLSFSYVYLFCISVFLCYEYSPTLSWMYKLDSVLEGRMSYQHFTAF
jgi:hypothetical protein